MDLTSRSKRRIVYAAAALGSSSGGKGARPEAGVLLLPLLRRHQATQKRPTQEGSALTSATLAIVRLRHPPSATAGLGDAHRPAPRLPSRRCSIGQRSPRSSPPPSAETKTHARPCARPSRTNIRRRSRWSPARRGTSRRSTSTPARPASPRASAPASPGALTSSSFVWRRRRRRVQLAVRASFARRCGDHPRRSDGLVYDQLLDHHRDPRAFAAHAVIAPLDASAFRKDRIAMLYVPRSQGVVRILTAGLARWGGPDVEGPGRADGLGREAHVAWTSSSAWPRRSRTARTRARSRSRATTWHAHKASRMRPTPSLPDAGALAVELSLPPFYDTFLPLHCITILPPPPPPPPPPPHTIHHRTTIPPPPWCTRMGATRTISWRGSRRRPAPARSRFSISRSASSAPSSRRRPTRPRSVRRATRHNAAYRPRSRAGPATRAERRLDAARPAAVRHRRRRRHRVDVDRRHPLRRALGDGAGSSTIPSAQHAVHARATRSPDRARGGRRGRGTRSGLIGKPFRRGAPPGRSFSLAPGSGRGRRRYSANRDGEQQSRAHEQKPPRRTTTDNGVTVIGAPQNTLRDFYYLFLKVRWSGAVAVIVAAYLALNAVFATAYLVTGGVANARPGSFFDAFCFSVETMGTIGYGSMYPASRAANLIMIVESVTSLLVTALATGLVFTKFSRSSARVVFAHHAVIGPMDGVPTLMLRVGNERGNSILEATIRVSMIKTEVTKEGHKFYRMYDLRLSRERSPAMARSWTVLHPIERDSPLFGATPESVLKDEIEPRRQPRRHRRHVAPAGARPKALHGSRDHLGRSSRRHSHGGRRRQPHHGRSPLSRHPGHRAHRRLPVSRAAYRCG